MSTTLTTGGVAAGGLNALTSLRYRGSMMGTTAWFGLIVQKA